MRRRSSWLKSFATLGFLVGLIVAVTGSAASAETLLMPNRDFLMGASEVVWGITTLANGTAFTLDYGDGTAPTSGNVTDRSYIAFNHTYALGGTFTVTLTVDGEAATTTVKVFDGSALSAFDLRGLNVNRSIQDGLRYLWTVQSNRTTFDTTPTTNWGGSFPRSYAALIVLSFENHGFVLPTDDSAPSGLYQKYLVQRGLNYVLDQLRTLSLAVQPAGDPCVGGVEVAPCTGLYVQFENPGYATAIAALPFAASGALNRHVAAGLGSQNALYVALKPYGEILQRLMNALAFGQNDAGCVGQGGWIYQFSGGFCQQSDGSTVGWDMLALLDSGAAGTVIPAFVKSQFQSFALPQGLNNDGSFDYRADNNPASDASVNLAKAGIGLQGLFWTDVAVGDARVANGLQYISDRWNTTGLGQVFACNSNGTTNKGCSYGMFNAFKALKLYGITTLPGVLRAAGPGTIPANDWYADYVDYLVANQNTPTTVSGGSWAAAQLAFSCCGDGDHRGVQTAIAELILAPVALILPDPLLFSTIGLAPDTATNPVGADHTVTATARSANGARIPGVTIQFTILTGPNAGKTGQGVTDINGETTFTYHDDGGAGTDTIQASIVLTGSTLLSNIVTKTWTSQTAGSFMTGGGSVFTATGMRVTHGGELHCDVNTLPNSLQINWGNGNNFHLTALTSVTCSDDPSISPNPPDASFDTMVGTGTGTYKNQPASISFRIQDAGEPGVNDTFSFTIMQGATTVLTVPAGSRLENGNEQAHNQ